MQDSIVLRPAPMVRKPKAQVLGVVVDSAPLTIMAVKTSRGEVKFKLQTRTKKYVDEKELAGILRKGFAYLYPRSAKSKEAHKLRRRKQA